MPQIKYRQFFLYVFLASVVVTLALLAQGGGLKTGPSAIVLFSSLALYCMGHPVMKNFAFTVWVFAFVAASMFYPSAFGMWFGFDLGILIVPLIQIIMFGMGTTLDVKDFARIVTMPYPVFIGMLLQFTIMPLIGFTLAMLFGFDPEVAAGIILIGSCPGGVASNLMTYLAAGNVALSVTMTSCSTLMSPVMTPFLMKTLAGRLVPIDFTAMMLAILNMIVVPIAAGLIANKILYSRKKWAHRTVYLGFISGLGIALAGATAFFYKGSLGPVESVKSGMILGLALIGTVALSKLVVTRVVKGPENWMDRALPLVSMSGICFIIAIITARSRDKLLSVGILLIAVTIIHNFVGYLLGYWGARAAKLDKVSSRTVAFEVGMQNGGMASGIAMDVLKSASAALAPAIFGPWMNISGSVLATWWRRIQLK